MRNRRLLIVDDSAVIRRAVKAAFSDEPGVDVVGTASNGRIALMKIPLLRPDVIVLDIDMPDMDGIETLAAIRRVDPRLPVIILNVSTPLGAAATLGALIHGATDHVTKPDAEVPSDAALRIVGRELVSKVALWCPADVDDRPSHPAPMEADVSRRLSKSPAVARVDVLAIGISTGGPGALMDLIPRLPAGFPVPILIVQHMPPMFTNLLANRLNSLSAVTVVEARGGEALQPGTVYIAVALTAGTDGGQGPAIVKRLQLEGDRDEVRRTTVTTVLALLIGLLSGGTGHAAARPEPPPPLLPT